MESERTSSAILFGLKEKQPNSEEPAAWRRVMEEKRENSSKLRRKLGCFVGSSMPD